MTTARVTPPVLSTTREPCDGVSLTADVVPDETAIELRRLLRVAREEVEPEELAGHGGPVGRVAGVGLEHAEDGAVVVAEERVGAAAFEHRRRDDDLAAVRLDVARRGRGVVHRHQRKPAAALRRALDLRGRKCSPPMLRPRFSISV